MNKFNQAVCKMQKLTLGIQQRRIGQNIRAYYPTPALAQDKSDVIRPRRGMTRSAVYSVVHYYAKLYQVSSTQLDKLLYFPSLYVSVSAVLTPQAVLMTAYTRRPTLKCQLSDPRILLLFCFLLNVTGNHSESTSRQAKTK